MHRPLSREVDALWEARTSLLAVSAAFRAARFPEMEGGRAAPMTFGTRRFRECLSLHLSHVFSEEGQRRRGRSRRGAPATEALCTTKYWTRGRYLSADNLDDWANLPRRNCPHRERPTSRPF
ncbi:hypothetical protein MRX96_015097 [Rhipicephalus microplus]